MKEKTERKEGHQQPWGTVRTAQKKQSSNSETTERSELGQICGSMKLGEKKTVLLAFRENIEMKLFSSDEPCVVMPTTEEEEEEHSFNQSPQTRRTRMHWEQRSSNRNREHPLDPDSEELSESDDEVQIRSRSRVEPKSELPASHVTVHGSPVSALGEETEIEMEVFPPLMVSKSKILEQPQSNKAGCVKWKRTTPRRTGLVVKDVICLHEEHGLTQLERYVVPQVEEQVVPGASGMTARITVDCAWSTKQMESRLVMTFRGKQSGQRVSFVYLQSLPGSKVLFVPETPAEGWTGEQVLRISGHGPLYVLAYLDVQQTDSEKSANVSPERNRSDKICSEVSTGSYRSEDKKIRR
ncbi:uncharacterized protein LOC103399664 isoform X2 [Cynoglossus semilaevis]|uniref:uncharacterized protein LOC103399664 isoform X2 n=1 Tax=Cynoglossus semilaevis TaxID=244447 RepID=UPI000497D08D|nr:uncharacterized protein LOC103399664 isoform X2 [Cynoglossus semilaevis]